MITVVERIRGFYDIQEVEFGTIRRWCPERVIAECGCGGVTILMASSATCRVCGEDLSVVFRGDDTEE